MKTFARFRGRTFQGGDLLQISMPMGGIGSGCVCLSGYGSLQDFSIHNRPATTALPDGHGATDGGFAVLHIRGRGRGKGRGKEGVTRVVEGPLPPEKIYDQGLQAQSYRKGGYEGLPRMGHCSFRAEYPFGEVTLSDAEVPLGVRITGWNPFVPLDDKNSSLPCAILEYERTNTSAKVVEYEFSYHLSHLARGVSGPKATRNAVIAGSGIHFTNVEHPNDETFGSASLSVIGGQPKIKAMWMRGGWFDAICALWRELSGGGFTANEGNTDRPLEGPNGGSILLSGRLKPGQNVTYPIVLTWHFPNVHYAHGQADTQACQGGSGCCGGETPAKNPPPKWRPYYVSQWSDAADVAAYVRANYPALRDRTRAFADALYGSTLPAEVLDAVGSNLAILKSPTVLRQENGNVWAWEGCFCTGGCCSGSCTHVWNYAQAMPHLFPALERTLREQELLRSMDERGHITFRAALPDGPAKHGFHAAADGQLGGILKVYRDWRISGDRAWLERMYEPARRSLEYGIATWDPDRIGALMEPHHNTYDIEFWGSDGMCTSIYVGALAAMAAMAGELGRAADASACAALAQKAGRYMDEELFNGQYYQQKVMWQGLRDQSFAKRLEAAGEMEAQELAVLRREGPKYQYGSGCLSDGVIGAWMARIYGLDVPLEGRHVRSTLLAIFRHNFHSDLWHHACTQRPGYALGHEAGLILCTWPRGGRPTLPFVYSDEVWTGIEYQVASHLAEEGLVEEALTIVRGVRSRYDGLVRNSFNEYECGNYYARAMASYALLGSLAGLRYSAATRELWLTPKIAKRPFRCFLSAASGWGTVTLTGKEVVIDVCEGELVIERLHVPVKGKVRQINCDIVARPDQGQVVFIG